MSESRTTTAVTGAKMVSFSAVVIRANGTQEDLGEIAYWHKNPFRRAAWRLNKWLHGRRAGVVAPPGGTP